MKASNVENDQEDGNEQKTDEDKRPKHNDYSNKIFEKIFGDWKFQLFMYNRMKAALLWIKSLFVVDYSLITDVKEPIPPETAIDIDFDLYWFGIRIDRLRKKSSGPIT